MEKGSWKEEHRESKTQGMTLRKNWQHCWSTLRSSSNGISVWGEGLALSYPLWVSGGLSSVHLGREAPCPRGPSCGVSGPPWNLGWRLSPETTLLAGKTHSSSVDPSQISWGIESSAAIHTFVCPEDPVLQVRGSRSPCGSAPIPALGMGTRLCWVHLPGAPREVGTGPGRHQWAGMVREMGQGSLLLPSPPQGGASGRWRRQTASDPSTPSWQGAPQ